MGIQGTKLNIPKSSLMSAIKNNLGRLNKIALSLGCHIETARNYISRDPELVKLLKDYREHRDESLLEGAEDTLQKAIDTNDPVNMANALKASMFVLNSKGKGRGYSPPNSNLNDEVKKTMSDVIQQALEDKLSQE